MQFFLGPLPESFFAKDHGIREAAQSKEMGASLPRRPYSTQRPTRDVSEEAARERAKVALSAAACVGATPLLPLTALSAWVWLQATLQNTSRLGIVYHDHRLSLAHCD